MSLNFVVIHEAGADFKIATRLADRALMMEIDWLDEPILDSQRQWLQSKDGKPLTWKAIPSLARDLGIRVHGHFNNEPGLPDAFAARRAIAYVLKKFGSVDAIVLIRDTDNQVERRRGMDQARCIYSNQTLIVLGMAHIEREAWVISGFIAETKREKKSLELERQKLGFDPCEHSHKLTAGKDDQALRSPKRVLAVLTNGNREREEKCWTETKLDVLTARGQHNGLSSYFEEVRAYLAPLMSGIERK